MNLFNFKNIITYFYPFLIFVKNLFSLDLFIYYFSVINL